MQRYVNYYEFENCERVLRGQAIFHEFGVEFYEFESGPGNYSTAIIELEHGVIKNVPVEMIQFLKIE